MPITTTLPTIAALLFIAFLVLSIYGGKENASGAWAIPACLSLGFSLFSIYTVWLEGPMGFWANHIGSFWGNQIWFDLLMSTAIGWLFVVPHAKSLGMRLPIWLVFVVATGNIGFMAMLSRLLWLRERSGFKV